MELSEQEKSSAFWGGSLGRAMTGVVQGLLIGLGAALILGVVVPMIPTIGSMSLLETFGGFLTFSGGSFAGIELAGLINPIPLMAMNAGILAVANVLSGGDAAVHSYHQQKHISQLEGHVAELEGRERLIEQAIGGQSRVVQAIIENGPRTQGSFAATEEARAANAPGTNTIQ